MVRLETAALFLVESEVGNLLYRLDEKNAYYMTLHDDTFAGNIQQIYEFPLLNDGNYVFMVFRNIHEAERFFALMRLNKIDFDDRDQIFHELLEQMQKHGYYLIFQN